METCAMPFENPAVLVARRPCPCAGRLRAIAVAIVFVLAGFPASADLSSKCDLYVQQAALTLPATTSIPVIISVNGPISTLLPVLNLLGFSLGRSLTL